MCGIVAYKGSNNATSIVVEGLKRLEYRGYDSWGIAMLNDQLITLKNVGRIGDFDAEGAVLEDSDTALGHTRWATHGGVSVDNSHPHFDCKKEIIVVHNGIIENYQEIKNDLMRKGHAFSSETDTEVIAHFIEDNIDLGLKNALLKLSKTIKGRNAIVILNKPTRQIFALKKGSPLVVGISDHGYFVASDASAFIEHTNKVVFLGDDECAEMNGDLNFFNLINGNNISKKIERIDWSFEQAKKGFYQDFTIKEIMEQPEKIGQAALQDEKELRKLSEIINESQNIFMIGCGTAGHAAMEGLYLFSEIARKQINFVIASEFNEYKHFLSDKSLVIAISQSGETADVLEAIETAKKCNSRTASIVNVMGSSLMRKTDLSFLMKAGPEISVVSTKAFTSQMSILLLLAYSTANKHNEGKSLLEGTSQKIKEMLAPDYLENIKSIAQKIKNKTDIYIIGKGPNYPIAIETALKIKEISYIHAEGFASGELKHGVIALVEEGTPCIAIVGNDDYKKDVLSGAVEIKSRGGFIIGIASENDPAFDEWIRVPDCGHASPIANVIPCQLLAYYLAKLLNRDADKPRNLAKSVTVK